MADHGLALDRGTMSRFVEHAGNTLGATIVQAMWTDAIASAQAISTDATGALIQPVKADTVEPKPARKGTSSRRWSTAVRSSSRMSKNHRRQSVKELFGDFRGYLQADARDVYDILKRGPPKGTDEA